MGCDIHVFIEYRVNGGEWQLDPHHKYIEEGEDYNYLTQVSAVGRYYSVFARLAGVRGLGPKPKGIPEDASAIIKREAEGMNWHSHSWCSVEELKAVLSDVGYKREAKFPRSTNAFYDYSDYTWKEGDLPPQDWFTLIDYCEDIENQIDWIAADKHLVDNEVKVEVRLIFWFDN